MLSAAARTVVNGDLCCGSCGRARAGGAALSTTAARTDRHPSCRAAACMQRQRRVPIGPGASAVARRDGRFQDGHTPAPALAAGPFVPSGGAISAGHAAAALAARSALVRSATQPAPSRRSTRALRACRAARAQGLVRAWGRDSDRADGGAHPANRWRSHRRLGCAARSKPISASICAPLGHDPLSAPELRRGVPSQSRSRANARPLPR